MIIGVEFGLPADEPRRRRYRGVPRVSQSALHVTSSTGLRLGGHRHFPKRCRRGHRNSARHGSQHDFLAVLRRGCRRDRTQRRRLYRFNRFLFYQGETLGEVTPGEFD